MDQESKSSKIFRLQSYETKKTSKYYELKYSTFYSLHMFPLLTFLLPDVLPVPTLILQRQTDVWHLLCTGSPAYPGAVFSLYLADSELPVATKHATLIHHHAIFPMPVQDTPVALYQCQYSVLMGRNWSTSERSLPLTVTNGTYLRLHYRCVVLFERNLTQTLFLFCRLLETSPPSSPGRPKTACHYFIGGFI